MCRHMAYLGPPVLLSSLLVDPPHSLVRQSWAPRMQTHGVVNADGFGVGWYSPARPEPALYRRGTPIWSDASFASLAGAVSSGAVVASVRSATPPSAVDEASAPPFASGRWLFALNGAVPGFMSLRARLSAGRRDSLVTGTDTESLFALVLDGLDGGAGPEDALGRVCALAAAGEARLNMLLCDGVGAWATAWGDTLFTRTGAGVVVASEPFDDSPEWVQVPDRSLVCASAESVRVVALA